MTNKDAMASLLKKDGYSRYGIKFNLEAWSKVGAMSCGEHFAKAVHMRHIIPMDDEGYLYLHPDRYKNVLEEYARLVKNGHDTKPIEEKAIEAWFHYLGGDDSILKAMQD